MGGVNVMPDAELAYEQMCETKQTFGKELGRKGHHVVLSCPVGEGDPQTMYQLTQEFIEEYLGDRCEALFAVHVLWVSMAFWGITFFAPKTLMQLFTNDITLIRYGEKYLRLIGLSYVFSGVLQVLQGILKNCGHVGKCTFVSVIVVCLNVVLNAIFIYGYLGFPRMEIAGAALATVLANGIGLFITVYMLRRKKKLCIWFSY